MQTQKNTRLSRNDRKAAKQAKAREAQVAAEIKAQIAARVAPEPKKNPNAPKPRKQPYGEGTPGFNRAQVGITMTAIQRSINEPNALVTVMLDENGEPTGETSTTLTKPTTEQKHARRESFVSRGLLSPFAHANERRKTRRRNGRYAAVGTKGTKPSKKGQRATAAPVNLPAKKAK